MNSAAAGTPAAPKSEDQAVPRLDEMDATQQLQFEAYREAVKSALASANMAADKILTLSFSLATAYGAIIGLVKPKDASAPLFVALPILIAAVSGLAAGFALTKGISVPSGQLLLSNLSEVGGTIKWKRTTTYGAGLGLAAAIVLAALALRQAYGS